MVACGYCQRDDKLFCGAWDGEGYVGHPTHECTPKTCGYSRQPVEMRPLVAEVTVTQDKPKTSKKTT